MKIFRRDFRLQDVTVMYFTALATLMIILVASYQAPGTAVEVSSLQSDQVLPPLPMPFRVLLDPSGELQLAWNISYATQEVYMELRVAKVRHGVVLGMSDRGELVNADLVVLWDTGARSYFGDAWSDSAGRVSLDTQQDYNLIRAEQREDGFCLLFKRSFATCDPRDYLIEEGTVHFIYGFLDKPLVSLELLNLSRIQTGLQRVPGNDLLVLYPDAAPKHAKNHIVMYEPVITRGNEAIVHHIEVFECAPEVHEVPDYSGSCEDKMKPRKLNSCRHVLAAWAMGAEPFYYPPDAGLPIGGPEASRFLRLEVHYHNPLIISGRRDSSGIRLHYTPSLRRYDAGIMELGLVYTPIMAALPKDGIFVFASQLHTHLAGRAVRTVVIRGGREVEVLSQDPHYSAHYQMIRSLRKMVHVLPGDVLITKCTYNTEDRTKPTVGGFGIMDEMCVDYIHYYPRTQLELCKTHVDPAFLQKYFNFINRFHGDDYCVCGDVGVTEQYQQLKWDEFTAEVLDSLYDTAPISMHCNQSSAKLFPGDWEKQPLPVVTSVLEKPHYPCEARAPPTSAP
ncbi:hypothetical protein WMY93_021570 [Mugilogobius chulae]|uniref:Dopamine beta-hydroxylase n=1 Tax=Mugilogobius chulae TaxID=88201 RepID=A0AAW0NE98_9GOBI